MTKTILLSLLFFFLSLLYLSDSKSIPMLNKDSITSKFLDTASLNQGNRSYIIYASNNNYKEAIDNVSYKWMRYKGMEPQIYKKSLKEQSYEHAGKYPNIGLTAQNIYYSKLGATFCIIHDKKSLIKKYVNKEHLNDFETLIVFHEIEHCYINGITNPIFSYKEFNSNFDSSVSISERNRIYKLYMQYLQEIYADIAAIETIQQNTNNRNFHFSIIKTRKALAKRGDFFHESSRFILDYKKKYNKDSVFKREQVIEYLRSYSLDLMPVKTFIKNISKKGIYLP